MSEKRISENKTRDYKNDVLNHRLVLLVIDKELEVICDKVDMQINDVVNNIMKG